MSDAGQSSGLPPLNYDSVVSINIINGSSVKPVANAELIAALGHSSSFEGEATTGFPLIEGNGTAKPIDALWVSPALGLVIFDLVEGADVGDHEARQDDLARVFQGRLYSHRDLVSRKVLIPRISVITFAPGLSVEVASRMTTEDYPVANTQTLQVELGLLTQSADQRTIYPSLLAAVQNTSSLRSRRAPRSNVQPESRGSILAALEGSIATLDNLQSRAVIEPIAGVQRIRGLAGSGKTIVLALKAATLHAQHPDWRIAVTFNSRSLKDQFKRLITNFSLEASGEEPDWNQLRIMNAWGSAGSTPERGGVYSEFCDLSDASFMNYMQAKTLFSASNAFSGACAAALAEADQVREAYDAILVDEAQDLPSSFLKMCYLMLREPKRLVYAYDELQNLDGGGVASPDEIFGQDAKGNSIVSFDANDGFQRDVVLEKCYRNPRPLLVTAHALGFGVYRQPPEGASTGLVQLFEHAHLWEEIGYSVDEGPLEANNHVTLSRSPKSSPQFLETHSAFDDLIKFMRFDTAEAQNEWVASEIRINLTTDELRHDDIVVVNPNGITARNNLAPLRARLLEDGIANHLAGVDTSADVFFNRETESVTFTGIHRAKGNEAGMVYVVNAEEGVDGRYNLASVRNRLFTAITRSKAWVRVLGVGPEMDILVKEFEQARSKDFKLSFRYPTAAEREKLTLLHRDVSPEIAATIDRRKLSLKELLADLDNQRMFREDLDPALRQALIDRLSGDDL